MVVQRDYAPDLGDYTESLVTVVSMSDRLANVVIPVCFPSIWDVSDTRATVQEKFGTQGFLLKACFNENFRSNLDHILGVFLIKSKMGSKISVSIGF